MIRAVLFDLMGTLLVGAGPNAADRGQIVPGPQEEDAAEVPGNGATPSAPRCCRLSCAQLLGRVFKEGSAFPST